MAHKSTLASTRGSSLLSPSSFHRSQLARSLYPALSLLPPFALFFQPLQPIWKSGRIELSWIYSVGVGLRRSFPVKSRRTDHQITPLRYWLPEPGERCVVVWVESGSVQLDGGGVCSMAVGEKERQQHGQKGSIGLDTCSSVKPVGISF